MIPLTAMKLATVATTALVCCGSALAQVNKCVDGSGKTVYSQSPCPPSSKASAIRQAVPATPAGSTATSAAKNAAPKSAAELELDFKKRRVEEAESAKKAQEKLSDALGKEENCRAARGMLASLEGGARQSRTNESGERFFLDESQMAQEKERARKGVDSWCK